jgi:hypothetical protein
MTIRRRLGLRVSTSQGYAETYKFLAFSSSNVATALFTVALVMSSMLLDPPAMVPCSAAAVNCNKTAWSALEGGLPLLPNRSAGCSVGRMAVILLSLSVLDDGITQANRPKNELCGLHKLEYISSMLMCKSGIDRMTLIKYAYHQKTQPVKGFGKFLLLGTSGRQERFLFNRKPKAWPGRYAGTCKRSIKSKVLKRSIDGRVAKGSRPGFLARKTNLVQRSRSGTQKPPGLAGGF